MLKYVDTQVVLREVPDEITLAINISNCPCNCDGCHSSYLAKDVGKDLTQRALERLIRDHDSITCVAFMGGDSEPGIVNLLAEVVRKQGLKVCWYSGRQELSDKIMLANFDYIKLGPYMKDLGPLDKSTTNQRFYEVHHIWRDNYHTMVDITNKFWRNG